MADPVSTYSYEIRRSKRARRSRITISDSGAVVVVLPIRAQSLEAERLVERHQAWIDRQLARLSERRRALAVRPSLAFGRVLTVDGQEEVVRAGTPDERAALERRLRRQARRRVEERVAERSVEMGIGFRRVTIRDQRSRWGSASGSGTLSFSWRLILVPPHVLDYVVVHELAHLRVPGHGPRFWSVVDRHIADSRGARKWLRDNQDPVRHALD